MPTHSVTLLTPSSRRAARPPTGTISCGRTSSSSHRRQNAQSSCSRGAGVRSPRPTRAARVAARDGRAVERRVERLLVEVEPPAQRLSGAAAPRQPLPAFLDPGRLAEHVRALTPIGLDDRQRLERVTGLDARAADAVVTLERGDRAIAGAAARHARTTTNQAPAWTTSPPPSSARQLVRLEEALVDGPARAVAEDSLLHLVGDGRMVARRVHDDELAGDAAGLGEEADTVVLLEVAVEVAGEEALEGAVLERQVERVALHERRVGSALGAIASIRALWSRPVTSPGGGG